MGRVHFISTNLDLTLEEVNEISGDIEDALRHAGCPEDKVIVLRHCEWNGSIKLEEPF